MVIRVPKWLLLCVSALLLSQGNKVVDNLFEYSKNIEIFTALYKELGSTYVDEVEPGKLMKTGIDAMLKSLDPYTNFFPNTKPRKPSWSDRANTEAWDAELP